MGYNIVGGGGVEWAREVLLLQKKKKGGGGTTSFGVVPTRELEVLAIMKEAQQVFTL